MPPVADGVAIGPDAPTAGDTPAADDAPGTRAGGLAVTALMLLPGALVVFTGFNAGGYFPATPAVAAIVVSQILLVRVLQSRNPFEGLAPATLAAIAALGFYALLTLVSAFWSHATGRALIEFDRAWLYLLILVLFGTVRASTEDLRWLVRGLLLGASIVCLAGLISRVLPDVWHTAPNVSNQRLSYPVTYWNTLGLLAALGIVLAFHLTCTLSERRLVRVLAAAVLPLLAATLFFTFSRGAIAAGAIGLVVYVLVARPRGLLSGVLATAPATAVLIVVAYHANLLDTVRPDDAGSSRAGSSRRAGSRSLRSRLRRPAPAVRRRPGSPPAPYRGHGADQPSDEARRDRWRPRGGPGDRPRPRCSAQPRERLEPVHQRRRDPRQRTTCASA